MPPDNTPFDPQRILEVLARHQVQCVVIGGYAAVLAGIDIVTRDIDITPAVEPDNLQRLAHALSELHAAIRVRAGETPVLDEQHRARHIRPARIASCFRCLMCGILLLNFLLGVRLHSPCLRFVTSVWLSLRARFLGWWANPVQENL